MVINLDWQSWSRPQLTLKSSSDSVRNPLQIWPYRFMEVMKCLRKQNQKSESTLFLTTHFHPSLIIRNFTQPMTPFTGTHGCISLHIHVSSPSPSPWMLLILWWKYPNQQLPKVPKELRFNTTLRTRCWERFSAWISFIAPSLPQMGKAPRWTSEIPLVFPWCCMKCRCGHVWRDDSQNFADSHGSTWHCRSYSQEPDMICLCFSPRKYGTLVVVALLETLSLLWFADRSGPSLLVFQRGNNSDWSLNSLTSCWKFIKSMGSTYSSLSEIQFCE